MGIEMHSHPDPDRLGHSLPMWLQDTTVRNTCCIHFYPLVICPVRQSVWSVDLSHVVVVVAAARRHWIAAGHNHHHLTRTTRLTPPRSQAPRGSTWMQRDPLPGPQRLKRHNKGARIYPGPSICGMIACLLLAPARETWVNFQKRASSVLFNKNRRTDGAPIEPAQPCA